MRNKEVKMVSEDTFLKTMHRYLDAEVKTKQEYKKWIAYSPKFPNVIGVVNPDEKKAINDFFNGLWESYKFLSTRSVGKQSLENLNRFKRVLGEA